MLEEFKIFKARDIVYAMGGSYFLTLNLIIIGKEEYLESYAKFGVFFLLPLSYIVGYLLQEIPSALKLFQTSISFKHNRLDVIVASLFIHDAKKNDYSQLNQKEIGLYTRDGYKSEVVERIQFLRSICNVFGSGSILTAFICFLQFLLWKFRLRYF